MIAAVVVGILLLALAVLPSKNAQPLQTAQSETSSSSVGEKTKAFWSSMRRVEEEANAYFKDNRLGSYPVNETGQFDFRRFSNADFDSLQRFHFDNGKVKRQVAERIAALPILGVDPELAKFTIELCEHWEAEAKIDAEFIELLTALHQQKVNFTSDEAYALRAVSALAGQPDLENQYSASQEQINSIASDWKGSQKRAEELFQRLQRREKEIRSLLTAKYQWEIE